MQTYINMFKQNSDHRNNAKKQDCVAPLILAFRVFIATHIKN